jgi:hypothetical protein
MSNFVTGSQVNGRKCSGIYIDWRLTQENGLTECTQLRQRSMEIDDIVLIWPSHKKNRHRGRPSPRKEEQIQIDENETPVGHGVGFLPQAQY